MARPSSHSPLVTSHCVQQKSLARIARLIAALFLAKSAGSVWLSGAFLTLDLAFAALRADHSGGTVADFHGLPDSPCQFNCSSRV
jgi:hypothetical protein